MRQQNKPLFERQNDEFMSRSRNGEVTDYELMEVQAKLFAAQRKAHYESRGGLSMYVWGLIGALYLGFRGYPDTILL